MIEEPHSRINPMSAPKQNNDIDLTSLGLSGTNLHSQTG